MEEIILKNIEGTLDALDKASIWILVTVLVSLVSATSTDRKIKIGEIEIERRISGIAVFVVLCGLNFYSLKLYNNLYSLYYDLMALPFHNAENKKEAIQKAYLTMRQNPWVFNPFSETHTLQSALLDNLGIAMNILLWWLGLTLAFREVLIDFKPSDSEMRGGGLAKYGFLRHGYYSIRFLLYAIYLLLGTESLELIVKISKLVCNHFNIKETYCLISIFAGTILFLIINIKPIRIKIFRVWGKFKNDQYEKIF